MASPQLENGYTRIAHEILEALARYPLAGRHCRLLFLIFRESYGRNRKEALLSLRELSERTGISKPHCSYLLRKLGLLRMVTCARVTKDGNHHKSALIFQKDFCQWGVPPTVTVTKDGNGSVTTDGNGSRTRAYKREKKTPSAPAVRPLIDFFHKLLAAALGEPPAKFNGGVLAKLFSDVLKVHPAEEVQRRISDWFLSRDEFIVRNGFAPTLFVQKFNLLRNGPILNGNGRTAKTNGQPKGDPAWMKE